MESALAKGKVQEVAMTGKVGVNLRFGTLNKVKPPNTVVPHFLIWLKLKEPNIATDYQRTCYCFLQVNFPEK